MTTAVDRKEHNKALRSRLANLTPVERQALAARGLIMTVEGRTLSYHNTMLLYLQSEKMPTVVGGYRQWRAAGRQVQKGQHGMTIWFPAGSKDDNGDVVDAAKFYTATVFDIGQTEIIEEG